MSANHNPLRSLSLSSLTLRILRSQILRSSSLLNIIEILQPHQANQLHVYVPPSSTTVRSNCPNYTNEVWWTFHHEMVQDAQCTFDRYIINQRTRRRWTHSVGESLPFYLIGIFALNESNERSLARLSLSREQSLLSKISSCTALGLRLLKRESTFLKLHLRMFWARSTGCDLVLYNGTAGQYAASSQDHQERHAFSTSQEKLLPLWESQLDQQFPVCVLRGQ